MLSFGVQIAKISNRRKYPLYGKLYDFNTANFSTSLPMKMCFYKRNLIRI